MSGAGHAADDALAWETRTWTEMQELLGSGRLVAILPVGATEAHGPHLPLATDVVIARGMAFAGARRLRDEHAIPAIVLPSIAYSVTEFSSDFPGTVSLQPETARRVLEEVGGSVLRQGARFLLLANAHLEPDHIGTLRDAVLALEQRFPGRVAFPDKTRKPWALELGEEFRSGACHAGEYEGSLVLARRPDWVRADRARSLPENLHSLSTAIRAGKRSFREAGGDQAYFGRPAAATAATGEALYAVLGRMLASAALELLNAAADPPHGLNAAADPPHGT